TSEAVDALHWESPPGFGKSANSDGDRESPRRRPRAWPGSYRGAIPRRTTSPTAVRRGARGPHRHDPRADVRGGGPRIAPWSRRGRGGWNPPPSSIREHARRGARRPARRTGRPPRRGGGARANPPGPLRARQEGG